VHGCLSVVSVVCYTGRGLCDEVIARPEESYRLWCVVCVWSRNLVNEATTAHWGEGGCCARNKQTNRQHNTFIFIVALCIL